MKFMSVLLLVFLAGCSVSERGTDTSSLEMANVDPCVGQGVKPNFWFVTAEGRTAAKAVELAVKAKGFSFTKASVESDTVFSVSFNPHGATSQSKAEVLTKLLKIPATRISCDAVSGTYPSIGVSN